MSHAEGDSGTVDYVYTLTLYRDGSTASYPFSWAVTGTGANPANAADFGGTLPSGSGTFTSGQTSKTITVTSSGDTTLEADETFLLTVTAAGLNTPTALGTITNDDAPIAPSFSVNPSITGTATEGDALSTLTYVDGTVLNGTISTRTILLAGVAKLSSYVLTTGDVGAALTYRNDALGAGGTAFAVSTAKTVQAIAPTASAILAPIITPQANPLTYPPAPSYTFPIDSNGPRVGDTIRVAAGPYYDRSILTVNDATVVLTGNLATDTAAINAKIAGISSGSGFIWLRPERASTIGDWSIPIQYGTAAVPALTTGPAFTVRSGVALASILTYAAPVKLLRIFGNDMAKVEIVNATIPGTNFTLRWLNDIIKTFEAPDDFNLDNFYDLSIEVEGFNGQTRRDAITEEVQYYDITPDAFAFAPTVGATRGTQYTRRLTAVLAGMASDYDAPLSITGTYDSFRIHNGTSWGPALTSTSGVTVRAGYDIELTNTASVAYSTEKDIAVTVGGVSATWPLTTMSDPATLQRVYRQAGYQAAGFDNYAPFTGIATYSGKKHVVALTTSNGAAPPATAVLDGTSLAKRAEIVTGTVSISFWDGVIATGGTGKSLVVSGGGDALFYGLWTTDSTATYVDKATRGWAGGADPQATASLAMPANGAILYCVNAGAAVTSVDAPGVQDVQTPSFGNNEYFVSVGHLTETGALSVNGPAYSNAQLLAVSYQP